MTANLTSRPTRLPHAALAAYALALVVGSLYPMTGWRTSGLPFLSFLFDPWPRWWTWFDVLLNIGVYMPGGLLLALVFRGSRLGPHALWLSLVLCSATALSLEALQSLLPNRVPSRLDWLANTAGGLLGALLAPWGARLTARGQQALDQRSAIDGTDSAIGITLLGLWLIIQWPAQRLLFGHGDLMDELAGLARSLELASNPESWRLHADHTVFAEALAVSMAVAGVGLLVREVLPTRAPRAAITAALLFGALAVKTAASAAMMGPAKAVTWLTAGAQGGLLTGAVLLGLMSAAQRSTRLRMAIASLVVTSMLSTFFPFDAYYASAVAGSATGSWRNIDGMLRSLASLWPYLTIAWCAQRLRALNRRRTGEVPLPVRDL